ncbi:MAG: tetratricopeptide repeat protein, partial [Anaerolineaceae bacterium]|nr:tetratricopeptide repeat protein [Anaerolineaceae bacterium]
EQAFDVQPSNLAIQDELKRLFGRRDGEQPSKIRLTRGALVRMYARGELFQQAITEILSILEEDPRRIDLEVILARMHYSSGAIDEAEADCNRILEKFPFCFEANRILQQIHLTKNNSEAATINKNRLISLDPYYQFLTSPFSDNEIPENKVQLDKLEVIPSNNFDAHIPEWFDEIDQSKEFKPGEPFNWANDLSKAEEPNANQLNAPFSVEDQDLDNSDVNNMRTDDEIPEWIKSAGWNSNSEFASEETNKSITASESDKELEISEVRVNDSQTEKSTNVSNDDLALLFTELKEGKMDDENPVSNGNEEKQFPPSEWMSQFSNSDASTSQQPSDQDFPDWLKNFQAEEPQNSESSEDMPDWLKNLQTEPESVSQSPDNELTDTSTAEFEPEETTFDKIFDHEVASEVTSAIDDTPQALSDQDDGWEKIELSSKIIQDTQTPNIETGELKPISSDDKIPDWVKSVLISQNVTDDDLRLVGSFVFT